MAGPRGFEPRTSAPEHGSWFYSFFRVFLRGFGNNFRLGAESAALSNLSYGPKPETWPAKLKGLRNMGFEEP